MSGTYPCQTKLLPPPQPLMAFPPAPWLDSHFTRLKRQHPHSLRQIGQVDSPVTHPVRITIGTSRRAAIQSQLDAVLPSFPAAIQAEMHVPEQQHIYPVPHHLA